MKKTLITLLLAALLCCTLLTGCGAKPADPAAAPAPAAPAVEETAAPAEPLPEAQSEEPDHSPALPLLPDGQYLANFDTDGSMFHVNEMMHGTAVLTVQDGAITAHLVMPSKNVLKLFLGLAEDAAKEGAALLEPSVESVTYDDGLTEEVYAFDVPVPVLNEEFDLALVGKKDKWYDHRVSLTVIGPYAPPLELADGEYTVEAVLEGGSGRAGITSPLTLIAEEGKVTALVEFSSPFYDYVLLDGQRYEPLSSEGNSCFRLPVTTLDQPLALIADTTAMSTPREIEYSIVFDSTTLN
ncbi:MAG: iron transporter [Oscillospiraceae bacterium]|nr:iron transporter [Oscillospiraceae bacterium]